jgi:hypothetical protein
MSIAEEIAALIDEGMSQASAERAVLELLSYAVGWDDGVREQALTLDQFAAGWDLAAERAGNSAAPVYTYNLPF